MLVGRLVGETRTEARVTNEELRIQIPRAMDRELAGIRSEIDQMSERDRYFAVRFDGTVIAALDGGWVPFRPAEWFSIPRAGAGSWSRIKAGQVARQLADQGVIELRMNDGGKRIEAARLRTRKAKPGHGCRRSTSETVAMERTE